MKKTILSLITIIGIATFSSAQIEIYETTSTTDISGAGLTVNAWQGGSIHHDFYIVNHTSSTQNWNVTRVRINEITSWSDYLCWGPQGGFGNCYAASSMNTTTWTTPSADYAAVAVGDSAKLSSYITPDYSASASATYRYYVGTTSSPKMDSVDVTVYFNLGLNEVTNSPSIAVAPNPSNDQFVVTTENLKPSSITIVDVLGNVVYKDEMNSNSKKVNVVNFNNGVYFVRIEAEDAKPVTKRIVVRH